MCQSNLFNEIKVKGCHLPKKKKKNTKLELKGKVISIHFFLPRSVSPKKSSISFFLVWWQNNRLNGVHCYLEPVQKLTSHKEILQTGNKFSSVRHFDSPSNLCAAK